MKSNSKFWVGAILCVLTAVVCGIGCSTQQPTAASVASPTIDKFALLNLGSAGCTVSSNIINETTQGTIELTSYTGEPVTVCNNAPISMFFVPSGFSYYNPTGGYINTFPVGFSPSVGATRMYMGGCPVSMSTVGFSYSFVPTGLTDGYDAYGVHVTGMINDPETPIYPPGPGNLQTVTMELFPSGATSSYDVSAYQGIQFYLFIGSTDSVTDRVFNANAAATIPSGTAGGYCNNQQVDPTLTHCYDGFEADYTNLPKNQWVLVQKNWSDLKQYGFGSITPIATFSGVNLQQLGYFSWTEGSSGNSGPEYIDFVISGVRFF